MEVAKRPLTYNLTDQASFFVRLSAGHLGRFSSFHWPALWDDPTGRLPRCQQHDLTGPVFANAPGQGPKLHGSIKLVRCQGLYEVSLSFSNHLLRIGQLHFPFKIFLCG